MKIPDSSADTASVSFWRAAMRAGSSLNPVSSTFAVAAAVAGARNQLGPKDALLITGSFFVVGEALEAGFSLAMS